jgi:hypothetical protein
MKVSVLFLLITSSLVYSQFVGNACESDANCPSWLACVNNQCHMCKKPGTTCELNSIIFKCCPPFYCQNVNGFKSNFCLPEKCSNDSECVGGFSCNLRLGKCDVCKKNGNRCFYNNDECCSNFCYRGQCKENPKENVANSF